VNSDIRTARGVTLTGQADMEVAPVFRWCTVLLLLWLFTPAPVVGGGQSLPSRHVESSYSLALRLTDNPAQPLFVVGITGGFTGIQMVASVYRDGRVVTVRRGAGRSNAPVETHVPLSRNAVQVVLGAAVRSHVFAIPRSVQDAVFGADIPVLFFRVATTTGVRRVHVMGGESSHPAGSQAFFPIWSLLYAIAGYPPQVG
jgi:hypothetical protein